MIRGLIVCTATALVALSAPVSAMDAAPLEASFQWQTAEGVGSTDVAGAVWATHLPPRGPPAADPAADTAARLPGAPVFTERPETQGTTDGIILELDARHVRVTEVFKDYVGASEGLVQKDPETHNRSYSLDMVNLRLHDVRADLQFLLVPSPSEYSRPPRLEAPVVQLGMTAPPGMNVALFDPAGQGKMEQFQVTEKRDHSVLALTTSLQQEVGAIRGDFVVYFWEVDFTLLSDAERVLESGVHYSNAFGQSTTMPGGVAHEARLQRLALEVEDGEFRFRIPGRIMHHYLEPASTRLTSGATWNVEKAIGSLRWGASESTLRGDKLHLDGQFTAAFEYVGDVRAVLAKWKGDAHHVTAERVVLDNGLEHASVGVGSVSPWLWSVAIVGLAGTFGVGAGALRWGQSHPRALRPDAPDDMEANVTEGIRFLKEGNADQVITRFEPGFDETTNSAPVEAYLLSLAHLQLGHRGAAANWILNAIRLYPDFIHQLTINDVFEELRDDPRVRRLLESTIEVPEVEGYV